MATKSNKQPAKGAAKPATKPAAEKPAAQTGVGIKELAAKLGRNPKSVRAAIRRINGGAVVGRGGRYHWESETDPEFVKLFERLSAPANAGSENEGE